MPTLGDRLVEFHAMEYWNTPADMRLDCYTNLQDANRAAELRMKLRQLAMTQFHFGARQFQAQTFKAAVSDFLDGLHAAFDHGMPSYTYLVLTHIVEMYKQIGDWLGEVETRGEFDELLICMNSMKQHCSHDMYMPAVYKHTAKETFVYAGSLMIGAIILNLVIG